jgi:hypothetical protein
MAKQNQITKEIPQRVGKKPKWGLQEGKKDLSSKIDELDKKTEHTMLLPHEVDLRHCLKVRLFQLLQEEEIKWCQ